MRNDELVKLYDDINIIFGSKYKTDDLAVLAPIYRDYGFAEMRHALTIYAQDAKFYPKPADLIAIARENRKEMAIQRHMEEMSKIKYDSYGNQIYNCPYCQDGNYMLVRTEEWCGAVPCLHTRENARNKMRTQGYISFRLPWMDRSYRLVFNGGEMVQANLPEAKPSKPKAQSHKVEAQVLFDTDMFDLPF